MKSPLALLPSAIAAPFFTALWILSAYAWVSNTIFEIYYFRNFAPLVALGIFILLGLLLYFVEGMEIAVGDLRDKEPSQLRDATTRTLLKDIQKRDRFFFSQRQVFAVIIISFSSLLMTDTVSTFAIYMVGKVSGLFAEFITFVFVNISILCVCQVLPKQLALKNSEHFLSGSKFIWPIIKMVGRLNISAPSNYLIKLFEARLKIDARNLAPSRATLFNYTALIHGFCVDQRSVSVRLRRDGSASVDICNLVLFLHGRRREVVGRYKAGEEKARYISNVEILGAWKLPRVEDLKSYEADFDKIFNTRASDYPKSFTPLDLTGRMSTMVPHRDDKSEGPDWLIRFLGQMPERCEAKVFDESAVVAILYRASGVTAPGSFFVGQPDVWRENFITACRKFQFLIEGDDPSVQVAIEDCEVKLDNPQCLLPDESERSTRMLAEMDTIFYPIQSAAYNIKFDSLMQPSRS